MLLIIVKSITLVCTHWFAMTFQNVHWTFYMLELYPLFVLHEAFTVYSHWCFLSDTALQEVYEAVFTDCFADDHKLSVSFERLTYISCRIKQEKDKSAFISDVIQDMRTMASDLCFMLRYILMVH